MKTHILILSSLLLVSCGGQVPDSSSPKNTDTVITPPALEIQTTDGVTAIDPSKIDTTAITTESSTGSTERPRN